MSRIGSFKRKVLSRDNEIKKLDDAIKFFRDRLKEKDEEIAEAKQAVSQCYELMDALLIEICLEYGTDGEHKISFNVPHSIPDPEYRVNTEKKENMFIITPVKRNEETE